MKSRLLALALIASQLFSSAAWAQRELLDKVVAVVNDEPITQSELDLLLRPLYDEYRQEYSQEEVMAKLNEARQKLLNQLIEDKLVVQAAVKAGVQVDAAEVDKGLEEFKKRFPSQTAMEDLLKEQGITMGDLRKRLEKQAMMREMHDMEIRSKVVISPKEIEDYYSKNAAKFDKEPRLKVRSITIKKSYESRDKGLADDEAQGKIT